MYNGEAARSRAEKGYRLVLLPIRLATAPSCYYALVYRSSGQTRPHFSFHVLSVLISAKCTLRAFLYFAVGVDPRRARDRAPRSIRPAWRQGSQSSDISLMPLPLRTPELNGQENIRQFMPWNRLFNSFDDFVDHCDQPWKIMSIACHSASVGLVVLSSC